LKVYDEGCENNYQLARFDLTARRRKKQLECAYKPYI
jgi:hypothetical protein